jgi:(3,5-dihydroxyphenyl)acetyl-CoA 1,2-dioxygenase
MEAAARRLSTACSLPPHFTSSLANDYETAEGYLGAATGALTDIGPAERQDSSARRRSAEIRQHVLQAKEAFFRRHAAAIYDQLTNGCTAELRVADLVYAAAERYPALLPSREAIARERALKLQIAKQGLEIDQGLFAAHVLADERCGTHLLHVMLRPKREAEALLPDFVRTGRADLGSASVERTGNVGHVTHANPRFLNAEDDAALAALETAIDLVLLDDQIEVGVLRGAVSQHPKYAGRRVFSAGINLTHLYYGQISLVEFFIERDLGFVNKMYRGHWRSQSLTDQLEDTVEKPWLAAVEAFAIGGGCQLLCVMDRVIAEPGAYFTLPASKEGFIPGAANLRLPRLVGIHRARQAIFFERGFEADTPEGMMICDEIVPRDEMDAAIARNAAQMVRAGVTSTASNRKALRVAQEPLSTFRRYMAVYCRQQSRCVYDQALIRNLEQSWEPHRRRM